MIRKNKSRALFYLARFSPVVRADAERVSPAAVMLCDRCVSDGENEAIGLSPRDRISNRTAKEDSNLFNRVQARERKKKEKD